MILLPFAAFRLVEKLLYPLFRLLDIFLILLFVSGQVR